MTVMHFMDIQKIPKLIGNENTNAHSLLLEYLT